VKARPGTGMPLPRNSTEATPNRYGTGWKRLYRCGLRWHRVYRRPNVRRYITIPFICRRTNGNRRRIGSVGAGLQLNNERAYAFPFVPLCIICRGITCYLFSLDAHHDYTVGVHTGSPGDSLGFAISGADGRTCRLFCRCPKRIVNQHDSGTVFSKSSLHFRPVFAIVYLADTVWGISAVGSALHSHCRGQEFESPMLHHKRTSISIRGWRPFYIDGKC
jgi:hypothetical protein